jgi:hypothetical protein
LEGLVGPVGPGGLAGLVGGGVDVALWRVERFVAEQRLDLGGRRAVFGEAGGEGVAQGVNQRTRDPRGQRWVVPLAGALRVVVAFVARVRVAGAFAAVVLLAAVVLAPGSLWRRLPDRNDLKAVATIDAETKRWATAVGTGDDVLRRPIRPTPL